MPKRTRGVWYDSTHKLWKGSVDVGWEGSRRIRRSVYGKTQAEAVAKLNKLRTEIDKGVRTSSTYTVATCVQDWLSSRHKLSQTTISQYTGLAEKWIITTHIGSIKLKDLRAHDVDLMLAHMSKSTSHRTMKLVRSILRNSINNAMRHDLIGRNVAMLAELPNGRPGRPSRALNEDQAKLVLAQVRGTRMNAMMTVSLLFGLRPGEIRGLTWSDVDFERGVLHVRNNLKNEQSRRSLEMSKAVAVALRQHRALQDAEREAAGPLWQERGLVFCAEDGSEMTREAFNYRFSQACQHAGLGHWHAHEGRHTCASIMSHHGVPDQQIADHLGHENVYVFRTIYRHNLQPVIQSAKSVMDAVFEEEA